MMIRRSITLYAAIALAVVCARPLISQELTLQHRWTKGETLRYVSTIETVMNMSMPGMGEMAVTSTITQTQQYAVQDVAADGTVTLRNVTDAIKLNVASPGGNVAYDSAAPPQPGSDPITDVFKVMGLVVGQPITLVVSRDGRVQKMSGAAELVAKLKQAMPAGLQMMGSGPEGLVSEDAKRSEFEQMFSWFPNRAVKPGESWTHEVKVATGVASMTSSSTLVYRGILPEGGRTMMRIEGTTAVRPIPGTEVAAGPTTTKLGDGTGTAEILVDPKAARLEKITARSSQPVSISAGPDMTMQGVMKTLYTVQLVAK